MTTKAMRSTGSAAFALSMTAGIVALLAAQPAPARGLSSAAATSDEAVSETISIADLNLTKASDQKRLNSRIKYASKRVCTIGGLGYAGQQLEAQCSRAAYQSARPQMEALVQQAQRFAAAGETVGIDTVLTVIKPESK